MMMYIRFILRITLRILSRHDRWARHLAHMEEYRNSYIVLVGRFEVKSSVEARDADGRIALK